MCSAFKFAEDTRGNSQLFRLFARQAGMAKPKYLQRQVPRPEVLHLLNAVETAAEAVFAELDADTRARAAKWRDELAAQLARVVRLLLVSGEAGRPPVVQHLDDLEVRVQRLELERKVSKPRRDSRFDRAKASGGAR